jgi:uncharacterized membrane protein
VTEPTPLEPEPWPGWYAVEPWEPSLDSAVPTTLDPLVAFSPSAFAFETNDMEPLAISANDSGLEARNVSSAQISTDQVSSTQVFSDEAASEQAAMDQVSTAEPNESLGDSGVVAVAKPSSLHGAPRVIVAFGLLLFVAVFASLHVRNHRAFGSLAYDTAIYDQAVWLMGRTTNPFMTVRGLYVHGHHVNPFLFLLVPLSWLSGGAEAFLIAQTVSFACGAIPVFGLTRYLIAGAPTTKHGGLRWFRPSSNFGAEWLAAGVAIAYLGSPMIQWINWAHFHPESFATLPFLCGWWTMVRRRWGWFGLCVVILLSTREETALAVTMMGLVMLWRTFTLRRGAKLMALDNREESAVVGAARPSLRWWSRRFAASADVVQRDTATVLSSTRKLPHERGTADSLASSRVKSTNAYLPGLLTSCMGGGWYLLCTRIILPRYNNGRPPYYLQTFFGSFGGSVGGIVKTFVTDPTKIISLATKQDRLDYYWALGRPVGFLFLLSPAHLLMVLPSMVSNVLTDSQYPRLIEYQYAAVLAGPLWIATIYALIKLRRHLRVMGVAVLVMLGLTYYAEQDFSPAPMSERGQIYWAKPDARSASLAAAVKLIPPNAGVAASDFVLPHLDRRRHAYLWPNPFEERYWGNYDPVTPTPLPDPNAVDWFVIDDRLLQPADGVLADTLTQPDGPFEVVFRSNGVLVGKRKPGRVSLPTKRSSP